MQIGGDQGLLEAPRAHDSVRIATAERFDVVVDFGRYPVGSEVTLVNRLGAGTTTVVMRFRIARRARDDSAVPPRLGTVERLDRSQASVTRECDFRSGMLDDRHGWLIGGQPFSPDRIDATPRLGEVEIWREAPRAWWRLCRPTNEPATGTTSPRRSPLNSLSLGKTI